MPTTKTKSKSKSKSKPRAVATRKDERVPAFAYDGRIPSIVQALKREPQHSATVERLYQVLKSDQFLRPRRIPATLRQRPHECAAAGLERDGALIVLRQPKSRKVSAKRTRSVK